MIPSDDDTPVSDDAFSCKDVGAANAGIVVVGGDVVGVVPGVGDCVTSFFEHPDNVTIFEIRRVVITRVLKRTRSVDFAGITVAPQTVATPFPSVFTVEMRFGFGFFFDDEVGK